MLLLSFWRPEFPTETSHQTLCRKGSWLPPTQQDSAAEQVPLPSEKSHRVTIDEHERDQGRNHAKRELRGCTDQGRTPALWPYIGNGIKRKPYPMFPYWQKRKILLSLLRPSPELIPCSDPAGKQLCLLLNWLKSRSSEEQSQSKEQQAGRRPGTERGAAKGRKAGPLCFSWGISTARSICWNHSPTKSRRNWTVVHVLSVAAFGETLCFLCVPPSPNTLLSNAHLFNSLFASIEELSECQDLIFWVPAKRLWCFFCKGSWKLNVLYSVQNQWGWKYILQVGDILLHFLKFQIWYFHRPLRPDACVVTFLHMDTFL